MEELRRHFMKNFQTTGVALTGTQLLSYARQKKLPGVNIKTVYQFLKTQAPGVQQFARQDGVKTYQSIGVLRPGVYFLDYGEFHKNWASRNSGATGFLVCVENLTNRLFALPTQGKDTQQWLNSIRQFVELTRDVRTILTDRDSVAQSVRFREEIMNRYGIRWYFLKKGHKSYLAERYIGFIKTKLSQALLRPTLAERQKLEERWSQQGQNGSAAGEESDDQEAYEERTQALGPQRWVDFLQPICSQYNKEKIAGTAYTRQAVHKDNFNHFLTQVKATPQPEMLFNSFAAGPFEQKAWNKKIFKFELGDKVLLARSANWKHREQMLGAFGKVTMKGGFGTKRYTVSGRQLRADKKFSTYVPVYSLREFGPSLHFYTTELSKISPAVDKQNANQQDSLSPPSPPPNAAIRPHQQQQQQQPNV